MTSRGTLQSWYSLLQCIAKFGAVGPQQICWFNFGRTANSEVRIGWLRKTYPSPSSLSQGAGSVLRGGCSSQSPARLPAQAAVAVLSPLLLPSPVGEREPSGQSSSNAIPIPCAPHPPLWCSHRRSCPFPYHYKHRPLSGTTHFVITNFPACQAEGSAENLLMPKPWELMSLLSLAVVTAIARVRMKPKEQKVLCEIPE